MKVQRLNKPLKKSQAKAVQATLKPGKELYQQIRAGLVLKGTSFHACCATRVIDGKPRPTNDAYAQRVVNGLAQGGLGPAGRSLILYLAEAAGIDSSLIEFPAFKRNPGAGLSPVPAGAVKTKDGGNGEMA
jgi:hypothetical protein